MRDVSLATLHGGVSLCVIERNDKGVLKKGDHERFFPSFTSTLSDGFDIGGSGSGGFAGDRP